MFIELSETQDMWRIPLQPKATQSMITNRRNTASFHRHVKIFRRKELSPSSVNKMFYHEDGVRRFPRNAGISQPNDIPACRHVSLDRNVNTTVRNSNTSNLHTQRFKKKLSFLYVHSTFRLKFKIKDTHKHVYIYLFIHILLRILK
jgi:hypothetical protein